jgi:hypothetical protein
MDSRFIHTTKTRLPKRKRVVKIHGAFEDKGKYFYCWNCGVICDVDRNAGAEGYGGVATAFTESYTKTVEDDYHMTGEGSVTHTYIPYEVAISRGCWFCGATNIY